MSSTEISAGGSGAGGSGISSGGMQEAKHVTGVLLAVEMNQTPKGKPVWCVIVESDSGNLLILSSWKKIDVAVSYQST